MTAWPLSNAKSSRRRSTAGGAELPGSDMPSASAADAIVLAVNIPAHEPSVGQARRLDLAELVLGQRAGGARADRLEHAHDVEGLVLVVTGEDRAAVEEHRREVEPRRGHEHAGQALVAARRT